MIKKVTRSRSGWKIAARADQWRGAGEGKKRWRGAVETTGSSAGTSNRHQGRLRFLSAGVDADLAPRDPRAGEWREFRRGRGGRRYSGDARRTFGLLPSRYALPEPLRTENRR